MVNSTSATIAVATIGRLMSNMRLDMLAVKRLSVNVSELLASVV